MNGFYMFLFVLVSEICIFISFDFSNLVFPYSFWFHTGYDCYSKWKPVYISVYLIENLIEYRWFHFIM